MVTKSKMERERLAFARRLNEALDEIKFPATGQGRQTELARKLRVSQAAARKWLVGTSIPAREKITALAALTGVNFEWLSTGHGPTRNGAPAGITNVEDAGRLRSLFPAPIVGEVQGGTDGYLDELTKDGAQPLGYVMHPTLGAEAYALRVRGDSMRHRFKPGEYIVLEPSVECQIGDDVVVQLKDGRKMLKELLMIRSDEIEFGSVNDGERITVSRSEIVAMHRVGGHYPRNSSFVRE